MSKDTDCIDELGAAANASWEQVVKGTYSNADRRIYVMGFRTGYEARGQQIKRAMKEAERAEQVKSNDRM